MVVVLLLDIRKVLLGSIILLVVLVGVGRVLVRLTLVVLGAPVWEENLFFGFRVAELFHY
jgi:hypothetical protein